MRRFAVLAVALAVATAGALLYAGTVMRAPAGDVWQLAAILVTSGAASLLLSTAAVAWAGRRLASLRVRLVVAWLCGVAVSLVNVGAAALLMFLNTHDLLLLLLVLGFSTVLSGTLGVLVTGDVARDLRRLAAAARRYAAGHLDTRTGLSGRDEVAQLAAGFDQMAAQLQDSIERERAHELARREMVAAVSHDLRTPLTTIRAMVEAMADGVVSEPDEVRRYLGLVRGEVQHLSRLIDDLFELSQIESGALRLDIVPVALPDLLERTLAAYQAPAQTAGIVLEQAAAPAIPPVRADPARLTRVLRNLLDNALRFTPAGGRVRVEARPEGGHVRVSVTDTGPGLSGGEAEQVFERFYRGARARPRPATGGDAAAPPTGAGLGLTIARGLVQAHGGRIWVDPHPGPGAAFHFTLPVAA
jgi:signal transduction histidine kinase